MEKNLILDTDSYKLSHYKQYDPSVTGLASHITARGIAKEFPAYGKHVYFGLQAWIKENLEGKKVTKEMVDEAKEFAEMHGEPFNALGWEKLVNTYAGIIPIEIQGIDEGSVVPVKTPLVQVISREPELKWIESYLETSLLRGIWYPSTVATLSFNMKQRIKSFWDITVDEENMGGLDYALHDFGGRGVSSFESAGLGGMAHLLNFRGSDTITGILFAKKYYGGKMAGHSVPAAEHSTITSWGPDRELEAVSNIIDVYGGPGKIYSVVGDTYDIYNFVDNYVSGCLLQKIKDKGGRFVVRPDSGNPDEVLTKIMNIFERKGLFTLNRKGFKVLPDYLRVLWGDGISFESVYEILLCMKRLGWSAENFVFGMGGALLQKLNRDSLKFSMKLNAIQLSDSSSMWYPVYKNPVTDPSKASRGGYINDIPTVWFNGHWQKKIEDFDIVRKKVLDTAN